MNLLEDKKFLSIDFNYNAKYFISTSHFLHKIRVVTISIHDRTQTVTITFFQYSFISVHGIFPPHVKNMPFLPKRLEGYCVHNLIEYHTLGEKINLNCLGPIKVSRYQTASHCLRPG